MQRIDGNFVYAASDLNGYVQCRHLCEMDRARLLGLQPPPSRADDPARDLIARKGDEHEQRYLQQQRAIHGERVVVFDERPEPTLASLQAADERTLAAMREGAPLLYQATFFDGRFLGRADFLRRVPTPSELGSWSYEVIDTKLALSPKPYFLIQLCNYSEHLARLQDVVPKHGHIVLGSGEERTFLLSDYLAYYRHLKASFLAASQADEHTYPYECSHCPACTWSAECSEQRDRDDHLSLVAFMRRDQIKRFAAGGIVTLEQLAHATDEHRPRAMAPSTFANLRAQAQQQHRQRRSAAEGNEQYFYAFREYAAASGLAKLPKPSPGDIYFDIEGDPLYRADRGLEYLWGYYLPAQSRYKPIWATDAARERAAFERFVDDVVEQLREHPDLHIYHYASYEPSVLKRLMGRYGSRENQVNDLLRREIFVDLYTVVRQGLWISQPSYSIKKLEAFYRFERRAQTKRGDDSIVMFESWLATGDQAILDDIREYNDEDCRSTYELHRWLLHRREELGAQRAEPIPWYALDNAPAATAGETLDEITPTERSLLDGFPQPDSPEELRGWSDDLRARWILGNLQRYHRREQRPDWWRYFERLQNVSDLQEFDNEAIGGLRYRPEIAAFRRDGDKAPIFTFEFPPQEYNLSEKPICPDTRKAAGTIVAIREDERLLQLKLNSKLRPEALRALIPGTPIPDKKKRAALEEIGNLYLAGELESRYPALTQILLGHAPRLRGGAPASLQPAQVTKEAVSAVIARLDESALFVQGPPGSGKSTTGAWAIVDLLERGKRIGIAAHSHKAVHNLLRKVEEIACDRTLRFRGAHKASAQTQGSHYEAYDAWPMVESVEKIEGLCAPACHLAAGTTFAWADEELVDRFDYLFIDEAGQVCLADALIAARAAKNLVLLGDPMQLPHVAKGSHPQDVSLSVLEHLCGEHATIPPDRGIFLDRSYRMHPAICEFLSETIYESRLQAMPQTASNRVDSPGLRGSGLVYLPVEHEGNANRSQEEAARVVREAHLLLTGSVTTSGDRPRLMTQDDIVVVAPYNLQRIRIAQMLRDAGLSAIRVGTVDKFQGQEAPVVIYSMAASSAEEIPRGLEFLLDRNRFNVALSRAQCMSVLLCSPRLLDAPCSSVADMALVNRLCAYAEHAGRRDG